MKKNEKKVVIVTGASKGIGRATAELFASFGHIVYGLSRSEPKGDHGFKSVICDVTDGEAVKRVFESVYAENGAIDCVINNAGAGIAGAVENTSDEAVDGLIDLNLKAVERTSRIALGYLRESRGTIINLSSVAAVMPIAFQTYYSATKAAVLVFTRALAQEVKPLGVKVTAVLPGDTKTSFTASRLIENGDSVYKERVDRSVARMAKDEQNGASPEKVAKVVYKAFSARRAKPYYVVGAMYKLICVLGGILPAGFVDRVLYKLYAK